MMYEFHDGMSLFVPESAAETSLVGVMLGQVAGMVYEAISFVRDDGVSDNAVIGPWFECFSIMPVVRTRYRGQDLERPIPDVVFYSLALSTEFESESDSAAKFACKLHPKTEEVAITFLVDCLDHYIYGRPGEPFTREMIDTTKILDYLAKIKHVAGFEQWKNESPDRYIRMLKHGHGERKR